MNMKFASRPDFITVKKSVMKLDGDGGPVLSDEGSKAPPQMDAPTRVRPFSVGKLRSMVEQATKEQSDTRASAGSVAAVVTTAKEPARASASTSLLRTPVKMTVVAGVGVVVFASVMGVLALIPKPQAAASAQPPPSVATVAPASVVAPQAPATGAGFVFTEPVVLLPGSPAEGSVAAPPVVAKPVEKNPERAPERHHAAADKPAPPVAAKGAEPKPDPKTPPVGAATANEMDEMRRIQQMANSQLDKSIH